MSSLALLPPVSLRAGTDEVGASPRLARVGLVSSRRMGAAYGLPTGAICRTAALVPALVLCAGVHAQGADPVHSHECTAARQALALAQQDALAKLDGAKDRLASARKHAQLACLGGESGHAHRVAAPDPPIRVPPPVMQAPQPQHALVAPAPAPPAPVSVSRPSAITTCDPGGCWDSQGQRLNRVGPVLIGPRGNACTVQGGLVQCP